MDAKGQFVKYLEYERKFSEHTIREYTSDLKIFIEYLQAQNIEEINPLTASNKDVRGWILFLLNKQESKATIHRRVSALKSFFKFHVKAGNILKNPAQDVLLPRKPKRIPHFLEETQIDTLFDKIVFADNFSGLRDKTILMTLYLTGIRRSELISIKIIDIDKQRSYITVLGKRKKQRNVPLPTWFMQHIDSYINERSLNSTIDNNFLFNTDKGKPLYPKFVYIVVRKYLDQITTMLKRSPHTMRHTFATHMLNAGADLNAIRELLGHSSLAATQIYTHNNFEKLKKSYKQSHPRS